jgi:hypothetical protein
MDGCARIPFTRELIRSFRTCISQESLTKFALYEKHLSTDIIGKQCVNSPVPFLRSTLSKPVRPITPLGVSPTVRYW